MNLLVLSDTHGKCDRIREAIARQSPRPHAILFLGDGLSDLARCETEGILVYAVRGNCDFTTLFSPSPAPEERMIELGGKSILMMHGHRYAVKSTITPAASHAARLGADILLFGHTHKKTEITIPAGSDLGGITTEKNLYIFNPGSAGDYDGSFGTLFIDGKNILFGFGDF